MIERLIFLNHAGGSVSRTSFDSGAVGIGGIVVIVLLVAAVAGLWFFLTKKKKY